MADRRTWTCASCALVVRYLPGHAVPEHPAGWWVASDGWICLRCRRDRAVERALADAGIEDRERDSRTNAVTRAALVQFELQRDPGRSNKALGTLIGLPPYRVAAIRRDLVEQGLIERRTPGPRPKAATSSPAPPRDAPAPAKSRKPSRFAALWASIDAALRADPMATDKATAADLGCSIPTVTGRRRKLEAAGEIPVTKRKGFASRPYVRPSPSGPERPSETNAPNTEAER